MQELLAPEVVLLFSGDWTPLGSKYTLSSLVELAIGIDRKVLTLPRTLDDVPIAEHLPWGRNRTCTRHEDEAYSITDVLGVNMQIAYGEGEKAFFRLQVEALKRYPDQTLLVWG